MTTTTARQLLPIFLVALAIWASFHSANAAVIINRPLAIGLDRGLVGYWTFDEPDMSGTAAYDRSGQGNTGTVKNGASRSIGKIGQALSLDGSDDHVFVPDPGTGSVFDRTTGDSITLSAWARRTGRSANVWTPIISKNGPTPPDVQRNYQLAFSGNALGCGLDNLFFGYRWSGDTDWGIYCSATAYPVDSAWHHYAVTFTFGTGSTARMYRDGVPTSGSWTNGNGNDAPFVSNGDLSIGATYNQSCPHVNGECFPGQLDDVRIYNRALTADEVKRLYNLGGTFKVNQPQTNGSLKTGLIGHWTFDGDTVSNKTILSVARPFETPGTGVASGTATTSGLASFGIGKLGQGLKTGGGNAYAEVSQTYWNMTSPTTITGKVSLAAWFFQTKPGGQQIIIEGGDMTCTTGGAGNWLDRYLRLEVSATNTLRGATGDGQPCTAGAGDNWNPVIFRSGCLVSPNAWHLGVFTQDDSTDTSRLYLDGALCYVDTNATFDMADSPGLIIGQFTTTDNSNGGSNYTFQGTIDDVRVYNRALSPDEIKRLYNLGGTFTLGKSRSDGTLKDGLVGHWTFEDNEMAGVTAFDRSGNGNNGTLTNGPTKAIGKIGQALEFDGNDDFVNAGSGSSLDDIETQGGGGMSYSVWIKPKYDGDSNFILQKGITGNSGNWHSQVQSTNFINFVKDYGTTDLSVRSGSAIWTYGEWQHIVMTWDGADDPATGVHFYKNGLDVGTNLPVAGEGGKNADLANDMLIGGNQASQRANGSLDDLRLYNRVLSPDEIKRLYNMAR